MGFQELAVKRYSMRDFEPTLIPKAAIEQILIAGNTASTAQNNQQQEGRYCKQRFLILVLYQGHDLRIHFYNHAPF